MTAAQRSGPAVLCIGETMAVVAPQQGESVIDAACFRIHVGGAESNVAVHVADAGYSARWFSRLGDDSLGRRVLAHVEGHGVDASSVVVDDRHPTGLYLKDPAWGMRYYRAGSAASFLSERDVDAFSLDGVHVVHLSGITAAISPSAARFADLVIDRARRSGVLVSFDVNFRPALWTSEVAATPLAALARRADLVFVGRDEAESLWGIGTAERVRDFLDGTPEIVVKDGDVGATAFVGDSAVFEPSLPVDVVEPIGAGDAFAGGYLAGLLAGDDAAGRLRRGHARAALTLGSVSDSIEGDVT